ncbi:hypothetical protein PMAYCL1PPCAC_20601, partial [Pristionchus mayeri]
LKVVIASDGQQPSFYAASALALVTTLCSEILSLLVYIPVQIMLKKSDYEGFNPNNDTHRKNLNKLIMEDVRATYYKDTPANSGWEKLLSNKLRNRLQTIKNEGCSYKLFTRVGAGAMVLVGYDEIQKWMH